MTTPKPDGHNIRRYWWTKPILLVCALSLVFSAASRHANSEGLSPQQIYHRPATVPFPTDNPYSPEKSALGKALFFEPRLSGAENMSCASCHNPSFGWEERSKTAVGSLNTHLPRHAPTILDIAWLKLFFWDGRAPTAEAQAMGPISTPAEMNLPLDQAVARLSAIPDYKERFERVYPGEGITAKTIVGAIATYERTVVSGYAPFDAWIDGDPTAISDTAKRGFDLFTGKARCSNCHVGWRFTDDKFHDIGTSVSDIGRAAIEPGNPFNMFAFKTPSLRDTAVRAPYMHDGQFETLTDVVQHYLTRGIDRPSRSPLMQKISLTPAEISDIVAFLGTLTAAQKTVPLPLLPN